MNPFEPDGFTDEEKKQIINSALSTASQVLISASVMTGSHRHITGDVVLPDGRKWRLRFEMVSEGEVISDETNKK
jgi:hypothetical protein